MSEALWYWRQAVCEEKLNDGDDRLAAAWRCFVVPKPSMFDLALASGLETFVAARFGFVDAMYRARDLRGI